MVGANVSLTQQNLFKQKLIGQHGENYILLHILFKAQSASCHAKYIEYLTL